MKSDADLIKELKDEVQDQAYRIADLEGELEAAQDEINDLYDQVVELERQLDED